MKIRVLGVTDWDNDDNEQDYSFSTMDRSDVLEMLADEEREKRETNEWDKAHESAFPFVEEGEDEEEAVENAIYTISSEMCHWDLLIPSGLDYEVIDEDEDEEGDEDDAD